MKRRITQSWKSACGAAVYVALLAATAGCNPGPPSADADTEAAESGDENVGETSAAAIATGGCLVTGCGGQVCSDRPVMTTCEWNEFYVCYQSYGICSRDALGRCRWEPTPRLLACLRGRR